MIMIFLRALVEPHLWMASPLGSREWRTSHESDSHREAMEWTQYLSYICRPLRYQRAG